MALSSKLPLSFVPNFPVGGHSGKEFQAYNNDVHQQVKKLEFWVGRSSDHSWRLKGIRLTWLDGTMSQTYGKQDGYRKEFTFEPEEAILTMTLLSSSRIDRIMWTTSRGRLFGAGTAMTSNEISATVKDIGSGLLAGFMGAAGHDIDRLAPIFWKFKLNQPNIRENFRVGGTEGTPFWVCRASSGHLVQKIEFWVAYVPDWDSHILRGMKITWDDGIESRVYGTAEGNHEEFIFQQEEFIKTMILWGRYRTDRIEWTTSKGRSFEASINKSTEVSVMQVGDGHLVGFEGASGYDIDSLAPIFSS